MRVLDMAALGRWIEVRYDPASGPGGQNVNKVSTRATLLFDLAGCDLLSAAEKARVRAALATRLARDGRVRVVAQRERTQARNRAAAEQRLRELLAAALRVPRARRPTRPTAAARARRLAEKRQRARTKRLRGPAPGPE